MLWGLGGDAGANDNSKPYAGAKCIDVPYAQFFRGMRLQMWACNNVLIWGQPNTEVTLGIARKTGH